MPPIIIATAALLAALILPAAALAQVQGGSAEVRPSGGFGCQPGMVWSMGDDGVARCKVVSTQQSLAVRSCAGVTGYTTPKALGCTFSVPAAVGGSTSVLNNVNTSTHTGSVTLQCDAGTGQWSATAGACDELPRIISFTTSATQVLAGEALTLTWRTGAASSVALKCEGANPSSSTGGPANGSATMPTPNVGVTDCILIASSSIGNSAPASVSWTVRSPNGCAATTAASGSCGFVIAALAHGQSRAFTDSTAGFTGSVTATCADGALSYSGATCAADPKKDCAAATATSGSCSFAVPALKHGVSQAVADGTAGFTGSVTATCTDGALSYSGATCAADPKQDCAAVTATSGSCSFAVPALKHGVSQAVADGTAGFTGSVTATCTDGALSYAGATCAQDIPVVTFNVDKTSVGLDEALTMTWSATNNPVRYVLRLGATDTGVGMNTTRTGTPAQLGLAPGSHTVGVRACTTPAGDASGCSAFVTRSITVQANCAAATATSGSCSFSVPAIAHGQSRVVADSTAGFTGSITAACANGTLTYSGATCTADPKQDCAAATATSGSCSFAVPALKHGVSQVIADGTAGFTGSVTATCTDGALSYAGATCAPDGCTAVTATSGSCSFSVPAIAHGQSRVVADSTAGFTGSVTASCANGTLSYAGATCAPDGCAAVTATSGSCSFSVPAIAHGQSRVVADSTAGFTGSVTASCANGTLTYSGATCTQDLPVATFNVDKTSVGVDESFTMTWSATNNPVRYVLRLGTTDTGVGMATSRTGTPTQLGLAPGARTVGIRACNTPAGDNSGCSTWVTRTVNVRDNCVAVTATSGSCSFSVPALAHGQTSAPIADSTAGFTGSVTATCSNGTLTYSGATCTQDLPVVTVTAPDRVRQGDNFTISWSATNSPTSYNFRGTDVGTQTSWSGTPEGLFGAANTGLRSVTVRATNSGGTSAAVTKQIYVAKNCAAVTATSGSCSFPVTALKDGTSQAFATSTAGFTGSVTAACADGTLSYSGASCTPKPGEAPCGAATHQYGSCSFNVAGLKHGQSSAPIPDSTAGFTGRVTATCNNGTLSYSAQSCNADLQPPVLTFNLDKTSVFEDETFTATWSGTNSPTRYEFAGVNRGTATSWSGTPKTLGLAVGTHTLTARACNAAGCSAEGSRTVEVKRADRLLVVLSGGRFTGGGPQMAQLVLAADGRVQITWTAEAGGGAVCTLTVGQSCRNGTLAKTVPASRAPFRPVTYSGDATYWADRWSWDQLPVMHQRGFKRIASASLSADGALTMYLVGSGGTGDFYSSSGIAFEEMQSLTLSPAQLQGLATGTVLQTYAQFR